MKKLFLLCICFIVLCSCDTSNSGSAPTATPKPVPQVVLGSTSKDFKAHFADGYRVEETGDDSYLLLRTDMLNFDAPDYDIRLINGKVDFVSAKSITPHNKGATCAAFMPKDSKFVSTVYANSDPPTDAAVPVISQATIIYESKWLAKQFPASSFEDLTSAYQSASTLDQLKGKKYQQPLAKPGTFTFSWISDDTASECSISIGKNTE
jgi:hypothetical protein